MKKILKEVFKGIGYEINKKKYPKHYEAIYERYREFTMTPLNHYIENLRIVDKFVKHQEGDIAECGVWRGGMSAGIAELLGNTRKYFLFDSFEGLPRAKEIDGHAAIEWQNNSKGDFFYDNCKAEMDFAQKAMSATGCQFELIKGWFNETLSHFKHSDNIALLRLDGDWYESIYDSMKYLYPLVKKDGLIIVDDYYSWDGCSKAIHDYLSSISSVSRIKCSEAGVCFIVKQDL